MACFCLTPFVFLHRYLVYTEIIKYKWCVKAIHYFLKLAFLIGRTTSFHPKQFWTLRRFLHLKCTCEITNATTIARLVLYFLKDVLHSVTQAYFNFWTTWFANLSGVIRARSVLYITFQHRLQRNPRYPSQGSCDGSYGKTRYFTCAPDSGVFVSLDKLTPRKHAAIFINQRVVTRIEDCPARGTVRYIGEEKYSQNNVRTIVGLEMVRYRDTFFIAYKKDITAVLATMHIRVLSP